MPTWALPMSSSVSPMACSMALEPGWETVWVRREEYLLSFVIWPSDFANFKLKIAICKFWKCPRGKISKRWAAGSVPGRVLAACAGIAFAKRENDLLFGEGIRTTGESLGLKR